MPVVYWFPIALAVIGVCVIFHVWCYIKFREGLHRQRILPFSADGKDHNTNVFDSWRRLKKEHRTIVTFIGAFGMPITLSVLLIVLLTIRWWLPFVL